MCWRLYFKVSPLPFNYSAKVGKIFDMTKFLVLKKLKKAAPSWGTAFLCRLCCGTTSKGRY